MKIHSHPGVRSDLFQRKLGDALVTDFFGGVSQAEVLPPLFSISSQAIPDAEVDVAGDDVIEADNATDVLPVVRSLDAGVFFAALAAGPASDVGEPMVRRARTWASSVGVLALVGWVLTRRK